MEKRLMLILGGARSGKSTYAERLAADRAGSGAVLYVATAEARDEEMAERIARHRAARPAAWHTLEEPRELGSAIEQATTHAAVDVVLVDCLTLWVSNLLTGDETSVPEMATVEERVDAAVERLLTAFRHSRSTIIVVTNEVGMGLVPPYPLGRLYRDVLGRVNARVAAEADTVYLMVAGLPLRVKPAPGT